MNEVRSQTKGVSSRVTIGIRLSCLIVVATILGLLAISHTTLSSQTGLTNYPDAVKVVSTRLVNPDVVTQTRVNNSYGRLPMSFELNVGQTESNVKFLSRGRGSTLFLTPSEAVLVLKEMRNEKPLGSSPKSTTLKATSANSKSKVLRMKLVGANFQPQVVGLEELPGKVNYFIGNKPEKWHSNVPTYAKVKYEDLYPGVDLIYYGNQQNLEYDFVVAPGADPSIIKLAIEGASKLQVDGKGNLVMKLPGGQIEMHKPYIYQELDGVKQEISGSYILKENNKFGFEVAAYDASKPLLIDPVLVYSTYLGGSGSEFSSDIAVDADGNAYITGGTNSTNFPTTVGPFQAVLGGGVDAFVAKLNSTGSMLVYSTYLGGTASDAGLEIAVDTNGNAYITGQTDSADFPTTVGTFQPVAGGGSSDGFVTKINSNGSMLVYSSYLGGSDRDSAKAIAVDSNGNAYITGETESHAFVTKVNANGAALAYFTSFGTTALETGTDIAVDTDGNAYVVGWTQAKNFPTKNAFQPSHAGGGEDFFITKLNADGSDLIYSTYLGGSSPPGEGEIFIAVDASGNAYLTGYTNSADFPRKNPLQSTLLGFTDIFMAKLSADGSSLIYSTYLGGTGEDAAWSIAVDASGNGYITGQTESGDFPTENPLQSTFGGGSHDAFVVKLNSDGSAVIYSTYLGGSERDIGGGITLDAFGNAYVTGVTASNDFPTVNPFQSVFGGGDFPGDAFVVKIGEIIIVEIDIKPGSDPNSINCNNEEEVIAVVILTTEEFDATTVDHTTVTFEGASEIHVEQKTGEPRRHEEDVDGDGDTDLVFHFRLGDTDLTCNSTEGTLTGETFDGQAIEGTDSVSMIGQ